MSINFNGTAFIRAKTKDLEELQMTCADRGVCYDFATTKFNDGTGTQEYLFGTGKEGIAMDEYVTDYFFKSPEELDDYYTLPKLNKGNPDPYLDGILFQKKYFKENINKYIKTPLEKIPTLDVKEILNSIKENKFDFDKFKIKK